jgi:hypothetical protein
MAPSIFIKAFAAAHSAVVYQGLGQKMVRTGGSLTWRTHNPGALRDFPFSYKWGAIGQTQHFAIFPSYEVGFSALLQLLRTKNYAKLTLAQLPSRYSPPCENDISRYRQLLEKFCGLPLQKKLGELSGDQLKLVAKAIERIEGYKEGSEESFKLHLLSTATGKSSPFGIYLRQNAPSLKLEETPWSFIAQLPTSLYQEPPRFLSNADIDN